MFISNNYGNDEKKKNNEQKYFILKKIQSQTTLLWTNYNYYGTQSTGYGIMMIIKQQRNKKKLSKLLHLVVFLKKRYRSIYSRWHSYFIMDNTVSVSRYIYKKADKSIYKNTS